MYIDSSTNYNINVSSNIDAIKLKEILSDSTDKLSQSMKRMSSGLKINSAKDDAANVVISTRMLIELQGNQICQNNIQQATAMLSTAADDLDSVFENISAINDIVIQAKNGTYSDGEVQAMQDEVEQHIAEIDRISESSRFSQLKLFGGDLAANNLSFQVGVNSNEDNTIVIDSSLGVFDSIKFDDVLKYSSKQASKKMLNILGEEQVVSGVKDAIEITDENEIILKSDEIFLADDDNKIYYIKTGDNKEGYYTVVKNGDNYIASDLQAIYQYKGEAKSEAALKSIKNAKVGDIYTVGEIAYEYKWQDNEEGSGEFVWAEAVSSIVETVVPEEVEIKPYDENDEDKKFNLIKIRSDEKAYETALNALSGAMDNIVTRQATIGSIQNRLSSAFDTLTNQSKNLSNAKSIITDADIAAEASNFSQNQILQQMSTSLLAQANQMPAIALSLI